MATDNNVVDLNWTDDQWNQVLAAVSGEAQRARVAASFLPLAGPIDASTVAIPTYRLREKNVLIGGNNPVRIEDSSIPRTRFEVNSKPDLDLVRISTLVYLHSHEVADPDLTAALGMFRRAANVIARVEDTIVFNGFGGKAGADNQSLPEPIKKLVHVSPENEAQEGLLPYPLPEGALQQADNERIVLAFDYATQVADSELILGEKMVEFVVASIGALENRGHFGPFACVLGTRLYEAICTPNKALVLPRDRILPFVDGQLYRSGTVPSGPLKGVPDPARNLDRSYGLVIALGGGPIELVVAADMGVNLLQTSLEPRWVFRVSERIALRIKEREAIAVIVANPT